MAAGHIAVAGGTLIRPIHMGLLAAAGKSRINVVRQPRITVIVTGSELLRPGQAIQPGKIYDSIGLTGKTAKAKELAQYLPVIERQRTNEKGKRGYFIEIREI